MRQGTRRRALTGSAAFIVAGTLLFVVSCGGSNPSGPSKTAAGNQGPFDVQANTSAVPQGTCLAAAQADVNTGGLAGGPGGVDVSAASSAENNCEPAPENTSPRTCIAVVDATVNANGNATAGPFGIRHRARASAENDC